MPSCSQCSHPDHLSDVALRACVFSGVLDPHQHNEVQVMPQVVLFLDVLLKRHCFIIKLISLQTWVNKQVTQKINPQSHVKAHLCLFEHNFILCNFISPQMKHVVLRISSFRCFSLLRSAKVSMMTPKIRFNTMMITRKKNRRSYTTRAANRCSCKHTYRFCFRFLCKKN